MIYIVSFFFFVLLTIILSKYSHRFSLLDFPNERKIHKDPIPNIGGITLFASFLIANLLFNIDYEFKVLLLCSLIILIIGIIDDVFQIGILIRLISQIIASILVSLYAFKVITFGEYEIFGNINLGFLSVFFTVFCIICLSPIQEIN